MNVRKSLICLTLVAQPFSSFPPPPSHALLGVGGGRGDIMTIASEKVEM